jgi:drug/metabolite transporter (DMT)-like permease
MTFLLISVCVGVTAGLAYKFAISAGCRRFQLITCERITIVAALAVASLVVGGFEYDHRVLALSLLAGLAVIAARWTLMRALILGKAGLTYTIWNLAVIIPVIASIFLFGEVPTLVQALGIVLVVVGIVCMREVDVPTADGAAASTGNPGGAQRRAWFIVILSCCLIEGIFGTIFLVVKEWGLEESRNLFILLFSAWASLFSLGIVIGQRKLPNSMEIRFGALTGLSIGSCGFFGIMAMIQLPGIVFFPTATALSIVLLVVASFVVWRERTTVMQTIGLFVALVAVLLVLTGGA